jgi:hypothetical protein
MPPIWRYLLPAHSGILAGLIIEVALLKTPAISRSGSVHDCA